MKSSTQSISSSQLLNEMAVELADKAQFAIEKAKEKGADRVKVSANVSFEQRLSLESSELSLANSIESQKLGVLVHKDQKKSSVSLNNLNQNVIAKSIDDALSLAKFSVADEFLTMPSQDEAPRAKELTFMFDEDLSGKSLNDLPEFAERVLTELTKDKRVSLDKCEFALSTSWHGLFNSLGVKQMERQTTLSWSYFGMAVDGSEVSGFDYDGRSTYRWSGALDLALLDARAFAERVLGNLRPGKSPSYKGHVLLTPRAVEELLLSTILYHASGHSVMDQKSKWTKAIGEQVVSPKITLTDAPHDSRFSGATSFDGDGLPTRNHKIMEEGKLLMHLHDCYSAKRTKSKSTATSGGPFALMMNGGDGAISSMRNAQQELLLVDRFSGNIDPIKGDFSGVAKSSRLLRDGKDAGAVAETMIAGNLFEVLQSISAVSQNQELVSGAMLLPWVLCDAVSVSGS